MRLIPTPDRLLPKTWVPYDPANCRGCRALCCTLPVVVTTEDLFHMGFLAAREVNAPRGPLLARLKKAGVVRSYNKRSDLFTLRRHRNNDCVFLDENRLCKIYDRRPTVCRAFPANSLRPGFCPSRRQ